MANKANSSTQTITLPQGGGALHGIGETFSPDLLLDCCLEGWAEPNLGCVP
jgi:hypothetical protein